MWKKGAAGIFKLVTVVSSKPLKSRAESFIPVAKTECLLFVWKLVILFKTGVPASLALQ